MQYKDLEKKLCEKERWENWRLTKCGKSAKIEFKSRYYCGLHDPIKKEKKQKERLAKWEKEYAENMERFHRQSLMNQILGDKTTAELEQMAKEKEVKNGT